MTYEERREGKLEGPIPNRENRIELTQNDELYAMPYSGYETYIF